MIERSEKEEVARKELQEKTFKVFNKYNKILIKAGTGSGKTKLGIELAWLSKDSWVILVPRIPLFKTWADELSKWGLHLEYNIFCYASAHKIPVYSGDRNVILDEAHRLTERSLPYVKALLGTTGKLICLSATIPNKKKELLIQLGITKDQIISYSLDTAVEDDLVADYRIQVIQFPLDNTKKQIQAGKKPNYFAVTEQEGYRFADQRVRQATYSSRPDSFKWASLSRMRFIYNLPSKLELASLLLKLIPADKKVIVFAGSILHANTVCKHRYHSKTDDKDYNDFCNGKINQLAVVQSVAEGVNIPNVDYAILMQVQKEDLHAIQKIGRILRKSTDGLSKIGRVIILEATGTQDTKWVESAISSFDKNKIDYLSGTQVINKGI